MVLKNEIILFILFVEEYLSNVSSIYPTLNETLHAFLPFIFINVINLHFKEQNKIYYRTSCNRDLYKDSK